MVKNTNISLIIKGEVTEDHFHNLNFLSRVGKISFRNKGEIISRVVPPLDMNVFTFTFDLCGEDDISRFISIINDLDTDKLKENNDVRLRLFLQSDNAQVYFLLPQDVIQAVAGLNIDMEISVLSWGECE